MRKIKWSKFRRTVDSLSYPWALDLCCGFGGISHGLRMSGFATVGIDTDPHCVRKYREHVGVAIVQDIRTYQPERPVLMVAADLPAKNGVECLHHAVRIGKACAQVVWLSWFSQGRNRIPMMSRVLQEAGFRVVAARIQVALWGIPHFRVRDVVLGFLRRRTFERFIWPKPPPNQQLVTVREAIGREYDFPAPRLARSLENRYTPYQEKKVHILSATEMMAISVGEGLWGKPLVLRPWELAVLAGLPREWNWDQEVRKIAHPRIAQSFPPAVAAAIGQRILLSFRQAGGNYAKFLGM